MFKKFILYGIGGGGAALIDLALLYYFTEYVGLHYIQSAVIAFIVSVLVAFYFQKHITFKATSGSLVKQLFFFVKFQIIGMLLYLLIMGYVVEFHETYYMIAAVIAKGLVFLWNFLMNYLFNFK